MRAMAAQATCLLCSVPQASSSDLLLVCCEVSTRHDFGDASRIFYHLSRFTVLWEG